MAARMLHAGCQVTYVPPFHHALDTVAHLDMRVRFPVSQGHGIVSTNAAGHTPACLKLSEGEWSGRHRFTTAKLIALAELAGADTEVLTVLNALDALFKTDSAHASWTDKRCVCSIPYLSSGVSVCVRFHLTWHRFELLQAFMAYDSATMTHVLKRFGRLVPDDVLTGMLNDTVFSTVQAATPWPSCSITASTIGTT